MDYEPVEKVEFLHKDEDSRTGGCPSVSRVIEGPRGFVFVGKRVPDGVSAQIPEVADDEVASFVPFNVVERLAAKGL